MIVFGTISQEEFLSDYWQKKPLLIKQALPGFITPISPDELAGLSLEEEFESRLVRGAIKDNRWSLAEGPFSEETFTKLPEADWTLLVQGVDRFIPEVETLIDHFNFIPRWRLDDVMISYAAKGGSVGPHFDLYDVFLLQGSGKRHWSLSRQHCHLDNYLEGVPLRIMKQFTAEQHFDVEAGDILYIPPKVAHHGVSLSDDCTSLSFGYRSYSASEMFEDLADEADGRYYQDPVWNTENCPAQIPDSALKMANKISEISAADFAEFVTKLDPLDQQILQQFEYQQQGVEFDAHAAYQLHPACKIAYVEVDSKVCVFINGALLDDSGVDEDSLTTFCNQRALTAEGSPTLSQRLFDLHLVQEVAA